MTSEEQMRQVQAVIAARGEAAFGTVVDGVSHLLIKARRGDRGARTALAQFRDQLREIERVLALTLPGEN